jgi:hypothetical protein
VVNSGSTELWQDMRYLLSTISAAQDHVSMISVLCALVDIVDGFHGDRKTRFLGCFYNSFKPD